MLHSLPISVGSIIITNYKEYILGTTLNQEHHLTSKLNFISNLVKYNLINLSQVFCLLIYTRKVIRGLLQVNCFIKQKSKIPKIRTQLIIPFKQKPKHRKYVASLYCVLTAGVLKKFRDFDCLFDVGTSNEQAYALSFAVGVPLVKVTAITSDVPYNLTISMMPSPETIAQALYKLTMYYQFDKVAILYDGEYILISSRAVFFSNFQCI